MKQNRIFIENLPETATDCEIKSKFAKFGDVTSIEIKERKVVTVKNSSCFFAYVNLITDDIGLQKCFQTFHETPWYGQYVKLQIAKESFLERLKRERETNSQISSKSINDTSEPSTEENKNQIATKSYSTPTSSVENKKVAADFSAKINEECRTSSKPLKRKKTISTSSSSEEENVIKKKKDTNLSRSEETKGENIENEIQIKKPNRGAKFVNGLLKIEDFGKGPVVDDKVKENEKPLDKRQVEAEARRKNALMEKIKAYRQQKTAFNQFQKKPKIIRFNDDETEENGEVNQSKQKSSNKLTLFENSDSETDDLNIQKNIENRIKSDERFVLDKRFAEDEPEEISNDQEEMDIIKEKEKEFEILGQILGKKFKLNENQHGEQNASRYVRYDPSNPDHFKYELKEEQVMQSNKKDKRTIVKRAEEKEAPEVSKERFHTINFTHQLGQNSDFCLSDILGDTKEKENEPIDEEAASLPLPSFNLGEKNPFKYDSSDDEDEPIHSEQKEQPPPTRKPKKLWTEPFFFEENDYRFVEGLEFVKRIATEERKEGEFEDTRRQFKQIVRNKIKNAKRKSKPFQKKLGGNKNKKKKMKRMDKALKR